MKNSLQIKALKLLTYFLSFSVNIKVHKHHVFLFKMLSYYFSLTGCFALLYIHHLIKPFISARLLFLTLDLIYHCSLPSFPSISFISSSYYPIPTSHYFTILISLSFSPTLSPTLLARPSSYPFPPPLLYLAQAPRQITRYRNSS